MRNIYINTTDFEIAQQVFFEQAEKMIKHHSELLSTKDSLGRTLSKSVFAAVSHPNYNAAAMDGIAVKAESTYGAHERNPVKLVMNSDYWVVDTGDCLPEHCDAVIMIEDVQYTAKGIVEIYGAAYPWQNVRAVGEDIVIGEMILPANHLIQPADIGALLCAGIYDVPVYKRLKVGIIPTGSEIKAPQSNLLLKIGEIVDSNSSVVAAMVEKSGGIAKIYEVVPDDKELLQVSFTRAAQENDLVVVIAGSSAGTEDYTATLIAKMGEVFAHGIAMKPGKPTILGRIENTPAIGLPGYPVATYMVARDFIVPLVLRACTPMLSNNIIAKNVLTDDHCVESILSRRVVSSIKNRESIQVKLGKVGGKVIATPLNRGAGMTMSLVRADGVLTIPKELEGYEAGTKLKVNLIRPIEKIESTLLCVGSHDIIIDQLSEALNSEVGGFCIASAHVGSLGGIMAVKKGETHMAPVHLLDEMTGIYNLSYINKYLRGVPLYLVRGFKRTQGLYFRKNEFEKFRSLELIVEKKLSFANRQKGSGTRVLFDYLLTDKNLKSEEINGYEREFLTHTAVALSVASGNSDVGMGIESVACLMNLDFVPLGDEAYEFIIPAEHFHDWRIKMFLDLLNSNSFRHLVDSMPGYCLEEVVIEGINI